MGGTELTVLVVDDDFRVANMHAGIVNALPGFTVTATANTLAAARKAEPVDLALVDVYLPDGSGVDFIRELRCDSMILSAATEAATIRAAVAAGALSYLVKPFRSNGPGGQAGRLCPLSQDSLRTGPRRPGCGRGTRRASSQGGRTNLCPCRLADQRGCAASSSHGRSADVVRRDLHGDRRLEGDRAAVSRDARRRRRGQDTTALRHHGPTRAGVCGRH